MSWTRDLPEFARIDLDADGALGLAGAAHAGRRAQGRGQRRPGRALGDPDENPLLLLFLAVVLTVAVAAIGLGAVLVSRAGTRPVTPAVLDDTVSSPPPVEEESHV